MIESRMYQQRGALLVLCVAMVGCGRDGLETVPVTGVVTVDGQPAPGPGRLVFTSVEPAPGFPIRAGSAKFDAGGRYEAMSFKPGDGLMPGKYQVGVHCWKSPPNMEGKPVISYVEGKARHGATSGVEITVEPGSRAVDFDIDVQGGG